MARKWADSDDRFVAAAIEPSRWIAALDTLARATGSDHAQLIGFGPDYGIDFNWVNGDVGPLLEAFSKIPAAANFRVLAAQAFPDEAILDERHYMRIMERPAVDEYTEMCRKWGILHGCQTNLRDKPDGLIGMALLRSDRAGPTRPEDRELFDRARREAAAAVSLQIALEQEGYRLIAGTFEAMTSACFVMDRKMRVRAKSPLADAMLTNGSLTIVDGRLSTSDPRAARDLDGALHALATEEARARRVLVPGSPVISLQLHCLPRREWDLGFAPYALAVATRTGLTSDADGGAIRTAFGLTSAETGIALMLAAGHNRDAIAAARGISRETIRSHLRALFAKLGVRREADAARLLSELLR